MYFTFLAIIDIYVMLMKKTLWDNRLVSYDYDTIKWAVAFVWPSFAALQASLYQDRLIVSSLFKYDTCNFKMQKQPFTSSIEYSPENLCWSVLLMKMQLYWERDSGIYICFPVKFVENLYKRFFAGHIRPSTSDKTENIVCYS